MNTEKPYLPVLVINSDEPVRELDAARQKFAIALEINPGNQEINKKWPDLLIKSDIPFLILVNDPKHPPLKGTAPEMSDLIAMCLFSKSYIRHEDNPVMAFERQETDSPDATDEYENSLIAHLQLQGWPVITRWDLSLSISFREQVLWKAEGPLLVRDQEHDTNFLLTHFLSVPSYAGSYIFFKGSGSRSAEMLEKDFSTCCQNAMRDAPLFGQYLFYYLRAKKEAEESYKERKVLKERLDNAEMTIGIVRVKYKDDYDLLFRWYQNEYEVLPLWYKRCGHIIKVLMGRRTLKSLFYKDKKQVK